MKMGVFLNLHSNQKMPRTESPMLLPTTHYSFLLCLIVFILNFNSLTWNNFCVWTCVTAIRIILLMFHILGTKIKEDIFQKISCHEVLEIKRPIFCHWRYMVTTILGCFLPKIKPNHSQAHVLSAVAEI